MVKVVIFNGPPRSGKDSIAQHLELRYPELFIDLKMALSLKIGCHELLGLPDIPAEAFNDVKDVPCEEFFGEDPRQFYIRAAETLVKSMFGQEAFGVIWLRRYRHQKIEYQNLLPTVSDCGFDEELYPLIAYFSHENLLGIRIHREGYTYAKDSRSYVDFERLKIKCYDVQNPERDIGKFFNRVRLILEENGVFAQAYS